MQSSERPAAKTRRHETRNVRISWFRAFVTLTLAAIGAVAVVEAQSPHYRVGRTPTPDEIKAWDIAIGPEGRELPPGRGTAERGKVVYVEQCTRCHGATGVEGPEMPLVGGQGTLNTAKPLKTVGSYWPYATTLWDYINRAMPFDQPGLLKPPEVYAAVAYVLNLNGIIREDQVIDANSLPKIVMPNRNGFIPDPRPKTPSRTK
jgi:S-disulfanyl-L-cysteine oxidoreductase SoxD